MFGKKDADNGKAQANKSMSTSMGSVNSLNEGTSLEGALASESDIRIDGKLKGTLDCNGRLILGPTGLIEGDVRCNNAVIEGKIVGDLQVEELLDIKETAILQCDIKTGQMRMQSGAVFQGKCQMGGQVLSQFNSNNQAEADAIAS